MKKLLLPVMVLALFLGGCGKKCTKKKAEKSKKSSLISQADLPSIEELPLNEIPLFTNESEPLLAEDTVATFAFVDDNDFAPYQDVAAEKVMVAEESSQADSDLFADDEDLFATMPIANDVDLGSEDLLVSIEPEADFEFERVHFDFNRNSIKKSQQDKVEKNILEAKKAVDKGKTVIISGNTCQMGSAAYNLSLSLRRAEAVKKEMVKAGIPNTKIKTLGKGYETPLVWSDEIDRNRKIEALSPNRRAELVVN